MELALGNPMDRDELAAFDAQLREMLVALDAGDELGRKATEVVTLDQQSVGRLSRMDALQNQAMAKSAQARRAASRGRILAALERIEDGEFGYCAECGEEIKAERLRLDPATPNCVACAR